MNSSSESPSNPSSSSLPSSSSSSWPPCSSSPSLQVAMPINLSRNHSIPSSSMICLSSSSSSSSSSSPSPLMDSISGELLMEMPHSRLFELRDNRKALITQGTLTVTAIPSPSVAASNDPSLEPGETSAAVILLSIHPSFNITLNSSVPSVSLCHGNYVFPTATAGVSYGVVLSNDLDRELIEVFENLLIDYSAFKRGEYELPINSIADHDEQQNRPSLPESSSSALSSVPSASSATCVEEDDLASTGVHLANRIESGSIYLHSSIVNGSRAIGHHLLRGSEYLKSKISPVPQPLSVSDQTKQRVQQAVQLSNSVVTVSKTLVLTAMGTASAISSQLTRVVAGDSSSASPSSARTTAVKKLGKATISSALLLYDALTKAGLTLINDSVKATAAIVKHRYGEENGEVIDHGVAIINNVANAAVDLRNIGVRAIARTAATQTSLALLQTDERNNNNNQPQSVAALVDDNNNNNDNGAMVVEVSENRERDVNGGRNNQCIIDTMPVD